MEELDDLVNDAACMETTGNFPLIRRKNGIAAGLLRHALRVARDMAAANEWTNLKSKGMRCDESGRDFGGYTETLELCKEKCLELDCRQLEFKEGNGWCNTYPASCYPNEESGGDWVAYTPADS